MDDVVDRLLISRENFEKINQHLFQNIWLI